MEERILEEPLKISLPNTDIKREVFVELLNNQPEDESLITIIKEEHTGDEPGPLMSDIVTFMEQEDSIERTQYTPSDASNVIIKDEVFVEDLQNEQYMNKHILSHTKIDINEEVITQAEIHCEDQQEVKIKGTESSSSLLYALLLSSQRDKSNIMEKRYVCDVCNKEFTGRSSFCQHRSMYHCWKGYQCDKISDSNSKPVVTSEIGILSAQGNITVSVDRPTNQGDVEKRYMCDVCKKMFTGRFSFYRHKLKHKPHKSIQNDMSGDKNNIPIIMAEKGGSLSHSSITKKLYKCNAYVNTLPSSHWLHHKSTCSGFKMFHCALCNKAFTHFNYLMKHKLSHRNVKKFQCNDCDKAFTCLNRLTMHKLFHNSIKNYLCDRCGKTFCTSGGLAAHGLIHNRVKKYECDVCNKRFAHLYHLTAHKLFDWHTSIRNFQCDCCGKTFSNSQNLVTHDCLVVTQWY